MRVVWNFRAFTA